MLPSQRVPQRLQILIIKRHQPHVGIANDLPRHLLDLAFGFVNCAFDFVGFAGFHAISSQPAVVVVVSVFTNSSVTRQAARAARVELTGMKASDAVLRVPRCR